MHHRRIIATLAVCLTAATLTILGLLWATLANVDQWQAVAVISPNASWSNHHSSVIGPVIRRPETTTVVVSFVDYSQSGSQTNCRLIVKGLTRTNQEYNTLFISSSSQKVMLDLKPGNYRITSSTCEFANVYDAPDGFNVMADGRVWIDRHGYTNQIEVVFEPLPGTNDGYGISLPL